VTDSTGGPALSVVVVTRDSFRTLRPIVASLAGQTIAARLELVIVGPDRDAVVVPAVDREALHSVEVVPVGPVSNRGLAAAAGAIAAQGPVIALTENHCFPVADWAERTLEAHAAGWVAVGPSVVNANPSSSFSRVLHAAGYGPFPVDGQPEERDELPLHNSSYTAALLRTYGDELGNLLADERRLQSALRRDGHALFFHPAARKRHINEATLGLLLSLAWDGGRRYGGGRARDWQLGRRLAYGLLSPALTIPIAANLGRKVKAGGHSGEGSLNLTLVSWLWAAGHALGEGAAYLTGEIDEFPSTEDDEFMIRERLGRHDVSDPEIRTWLGLLD
jgi:hypothetical protein